MAVLDFHPVSPISPFLHTTYFHLMHVLISRLISPNYGSPECGHSALAFFDLHSAPDAIFKVKINMQKTSVQMKVNHYTNSSSII